MFLQWGFTQEGVELMYAANKPQYVDFDDESVTTVYVDKEEL